MIDTKLVRHEFRNQLAVIRGFAELMLADAPADHPHRGDLEEIRAAALTALELLARLYPRTEAADREHPDC